MFLYAVKHSDYDNDGCSFVLIQIWCYSDWEGDRDSTSTLVQLMFVVGSDNLMHFLLNRKKQFRLKAPEQNLYLRESNIEPFDCSTKRKRVAKCQKVLCCNKIRFAIRIQEISLFLFLRLFTRGNECNKIISELWQLDFMRSDDKNQIDLKQSHPMHMKQQKRVSFGKFPLMKPAFVRNNIRKAFLMCVTLFPVKTHDVSPHHTASFLYTNEASFNKAFRFLIP